MQIEPVTVSAVTQRIRKILTTQFDRLSVTGEISNISLSKAGHIYFDLKDEKALLPCVMWRGDAWRLTGKPANGDKVVIQGALDLYPPQGRYRCIVRSIEKQGLGELLVALERRKQYYQQKGYFDASAKKEIPLYPEKVVIITSSKGRAVQDILKICWERAPHMDILIIPTAVQGEEAPLSIAQNIRMANLLDAGDLIITGRGGGSTEDLIAFSSPEVIEAIYESRIPVISAVGHEPDHMLSDSVADAVAATPTDGAVIATKGYYRLHQDMLHSRETLNRIIRHSLNSKTAEIKKLNLSSLLKGKIQTMEHNRLFASDMLSARMEQKLTDSAHRLERETLLLAHRNPAGRMESVQREFDAGRKALLDSMKRKVELTNRKLEEAEHSLALLNPLAVLARGYTVVTDTRNRVIPYSGIKGGDEVVIRFKEGTKHATIKE